MNIKLVLLCTLHLKLSTQYNMHLFITRFYHDIFNIIPNIYGPLVNILDILYLTPSTRFDHW